MITNMSISLSKGVQNNYSVPLFVGVGESFKAPLSSYEAKWGFMLNTHTLVVIWVDGY